MGTMSNIIKVEAPKSSLLKSRWNYAQKQDKVINKDFKMKLKPGLPLAARGKPPLKPNNVPVSAALKNPQDVRITRRAPS